MKVFDGKFRSTCNLTAALMRRRVSRKFSDVASSSQALIKVRVRIDNVLYVDYLFIPPDRRVMARNGEIVPYRAPL
jgi:hypothetical protein